MSWDNAVNWDMVITAAAGRPKALGDIVQSLAIRNDAALTTLLLLEETPHPAAALVAAAATWWWRAAPPVHAALAPQIDAALAAWRADPHWAERAIGGQAARLQWNVSGMAAALRARPDALHDAVAIVLHMGSVDAVAHCIKALGADGWTMLDADLRGALLARAAADTLCWVWTALDESQRAAAAQAAANPNRAARFIGRIGAAAWSEIAPGLRRRLIAAAARNPNWVPATAPAWPSMTPHERARLIAAVMRRGAAADAFQLLEDLAPAGRATLTSKQRAALDARAKEHDAWRVLTWRAADAGWGALRGESRRAALAGAEEDPRRVAVLLRAVGMAGWRAMPTNDRKRLAVVVQSSCENLFACPPALWSDLVGDALPPATSIPRDIMGDWIAEDADADLSRLPAAHQAVILALAPWRMEDAAKDSVRMQRLRAVWNALAADARVALVTAHLRLLTIVAAATRLHGGAAAARDGVGETVARFAAATDGAAAARIVGATLRAHDRWRDWMSDFAPADADPSAAWDAWRDAARCGFVPDFAICARVAAKRQEDPASPRALQRA